MLKQGIAWGESYDYLVRARTNILAGQATLDSFNDVTLGAVGVGTGGAAVTTLARGSADSILGLLTLGGLGYSLNQVSTPQVQLDIYKAGLKRLLCVERTGKRLNSATTYTRQALPQWQDELDRALSNLSIDISYGKAALRADSTDVALREQLTSAQVFVAQAHTLRLDVVKYLQSTDVPFDMYLAVDRVVTELNDQLRARAAKPDDVAKLGDNIIGFKKARQFETPSTATTSVDGKLPDGITVAGHAAIADTILSDTKRLAEVMAVLQSLLPVAGYETTEALEACFSNLPTQGFFTATPSGPINLTVGQDPYTLTIDTDASAIELSFAGTTPTAQNLLVSNPSGTIYSFAAPANAEERSYIIFFHRKSETQRLGPNFEIKVTRVAAKLGDKPVVKGGGVANKPGNQSLDFGKKLVLLGLNATGVVIKDERDQNFITRVQKLNVCVGLPAGDGSLKDDLIAKLKKKNAVNSVGECPGDLDIAAGPAVNKAPIPSSPVIAAPKAVAPPASAASK